MLQILKNMPFLTIIMITLLIWIGVRALRPRTIRYRQLYILPSVFLIISANQIFGTYGWNARVFAVWIAALVLAGTMSWRTAEKTQIAIDRNAATIDLPGTWITLTLILIFIVVRLYFGRQLYVAPELRTDANFATQVLATTGIVSGFYLGRSTSYLTRFFRTPR